MSDLLKVRVGGSDYLCKWVDPRTAEIGGREYRTVRIGNQTWLAQNLDFAWNGLSVPTSGASTSTDPQAMYYDYNEVSYGWGGFQLGLLYNWYAVKYLEDNKSTLIPGWHVPTIQELETLVDFVGGESIAGTKLKALDGSVTTSWPSSWGGTDDYGFDLLPVGYYGTSGFTGFNTSPMLWSITEGEFDADFACALGARTGAAIYGYGGYEFGKSLQFSLRLVKDAT